MKISNYEDLVAYKKHLKTQENLSQKVMSHSIKENKKKMNSLIKKALIPIGVAAFGYVLGKVLDPNDEDLNDTQEVKVKKVNNGTLYTAIDIAKIVIPLVSAYITKRQVEKVD